MSEKLLLVDGHSIINRAFYGVTDLTNSEGLHTNAIYGFLNTLFKVLDEEKPDYMAVAFDVHAPTFRHKIYDAYKGTRKPMPEELRQQVPVLKEVLGAMGILTMECAGLEADDLLGTNAKKGEERGMEVTVLSGDRDLLQIATDRIRIRMPKTRGGVTETENYYADDVLAKYRVTPPQIIELKALMGDASDNIPGVPGIGEKTATAIIEKYGDIENAYAHVDEIMPKRARTSLSEHFDMARLSKTLATINTDCGYEIDWERARLGNIFTEEAYRYFRRLEFRNLLQRFDINPLQDASAGFSIRIIDASCGEEAAAVLERARAADRLALAAVEEKGTLTAWSLTFSEEETYIFLSENDAAFDAAGLIDTFRGREFDCLDLKGMLHLAGTSSVPEERQSMFRDAGIAAYLLNPLKDGYSCEDLSREYLEETVPTRAEYFGKLPIRAAVKEKPEEFRAYAASLSRIIFRAVPGLLERLRETGMDRLYLDLEMPLVFTLYEMEREGIRADAEALKEYSRELAAQIEELENRIYTEAGETFNINSPKQLGVILFEKLGLKGGKKTKTGYSTAADVLEKLAPDNPIVADVLEYRQLSKLKSTYTDALPGFIAADGRIHTTFQQTVTATGRLSSVEPNLQNIPVRMEIGRRIRKVFIPADGMIFVDADYSQIELRVLAHMSGDENLIKAYNEESDIHRITASQVFHVPFDEVTPQQRRNAKAVNFGIIYGISSFGLSQDLSITRKEAQEYIEQYFQTYPKIKGFLDKCVEKAKKLGYAETLFGRRRPVPELKSSNYMQRSFGERVAMNAPVQGTAADIIKIAMLRVDRRLKKEGFRSKLLLQIHDELLIETAPEELEAVKKLLREEMEGAADLLVPLETDAKQGKSWYEAH